MKCGKKTAPPARVLAPTPRFYKDLEDQSPDDQNLIEGKLKLFLSDPHHPSLRVKPVRGSKGVWELSVTLRIRITFSKESRGAQTIYQLRRVGGHDVFGSP